MRRLSCALCCAFAALASFPLDAQVSLRVEADCLAPNVHEPLFLGVEIRNDAAEDEVVLLASPPFRVERFDADEQVWTNVELDAGKQPAQHPPGIVESLPVIIPQGVRVGARDKTWACVQEKPLRQLTEVAGRIRIKAVGQRRDHDPDRSEGDDLESPWLEILVQAHADNARLLDAPNRSESLWLAFNEVVFGEHPKDAKQDFRDSWSLVERSTLSERIRDCARLYHAVQGTSTNCFDGVIDPTRWLRAFGILDDIDLDRYPREIGGVGYAALVYRAHGCRMLGDCESAAQFYGLIESKYPGNVAFERGTYGRTPKAKDRTDAPAQPK